MDPIVLTNSATFLSLVRDLSGRELLAEEVVPSCSAGALEPWGRSFCDMEVSEHDDVSNNQRVPDPSY